MKTPIARACSLAALLAGLVPFACSDAGRGPNGTPSPDSTGEVGLSLRTANGEILNAVSYQITGSGGFSKSGSIDVSQSTMISATIGGLPAGTGFTITLTGTTVEGNTVCAGSAMFDVFTHQSSSVMVKLTCHEAPRTGSALVTGALNICPVIDGVGASPQEVNVGGSLTLSAMAHDSDAAPAALSYSWSAATGTFSDAKSPSPMFTCTATGPVDVTVTVSDGDATPGCADKSTVTVNCSPGPLQNDVQNIVVIYAENRSFDGLFGNYPGAHGLSEVVDAMGNPTMAYVPQKDRDGSVLPKLPKAWGGATAAGNPTVVTEALTDNLPNAPFGMENAFVANGAPAVTTLDVMHDMQHRFFENIMEINGGTNDMYSAWLDAGGLGMGHFDYSHSQLYALAQQGVVADNFFEGAFGGSFLNHQYLICACAPTVPTSFITSNSPSVNVLGMPNAKGVPQLATTANPPPSAISGPPGFVKTGNIAPLDYFGVGDGYRAVNTMQPAFEPSGNQPVAASMDTRYADPSTGTSLPAQTQTTMGDLLTAKGIDWAWYATSWDDAVADGTQVRGAARTVIYTPSQPRGNPDFQAHHHPYNYYQAFDPATHAADRAQHLKDYKALVAQAAAGTLPPVAWYKPTGYVNQHPGYANLDDGDAHITDLINKLKASPQWAHMIIIVTYDEYGGQWDHVAPPKGDKIGPGTRIPAIIFSPFAKAGTVDHTQYDSASTLRLITHRFGVSTLPGLAARDAALVSNGGSAMGDLTNALNLP
jgi:acid phosphatase